MGTQDISSKGVRKDSVKWSNGVICIVSLVVWLSAVILTPGEVEANQSKSDYCFNCHSLDATADTTASVIQTAVNGSPGNSVTVAPGESFEVDWTFTNLSGNTQKDVLAVGVSTPAYGNPPTNDTALTTLWTVAAGTENSPTVTGGWNIVWDRAGAGNATGSTNLYVNRGNYADQTTLSNYWPDYPVVDVIDWAASDQTWGTGGGQKSACDNSFTGTKCSGDRDGIDRKMGGDATVTVSSNTPDGTYKVALFGVGHRMSDGGQAYVKAEITVTVSTPVVHSVLFTNAAFSQSENVTTANLTVSRVNGSTGAISVECADAGTGTATSGGGNDYTMTSPQTLNWADGDTADKNCVITINNDAVDENDQTVDVLLQNPSGVALGAQTTATLTITDDDAAPTIAFDTGSSSGNEANSPASMAVSLSAASEKTVTVEYDTTNGSATAGSDYTAVAGGTLTFNPGVITQNATVAITDDTAVEGDETFTVDLSVPTNASLGGTTTHTYTILNDDSSVAFTSATYSQVENVATANLTVSRTGSSSGAISVQCADAGTGSATAGAANDYTMTSPQTLNWADGDTADKDCVVTINNDTTDEDDQTVNVFLQSPSGTILGAQDTAILTITDNDNPPTVSFDAASSSGNEATTPASIPVSLSEASEKTISVSYGTANGTATAGSDYTAVVGGTLTFAPGVTTQNATVTIADDGTTEPDETFSVTISSPTNATLAAPATHTYTILNDDTAAGTLQFTSATFSEAENVATANLTVSRAGGSAGAVSVQCADAGTGSATAGGGNDYTMTTPQTLNWADGDTANKNCVVTINDDSLDEDNETINALLQNAGGGASLGGQATATLTITDNDNPPTVSFDAGSSNGDEATTPASIPVSLSAASGKTITVTVDTTDGTATAGSDYTAISGGTLTFSPGETTKNITVTISDDGTVEPNETFDITISSPGNATLGATTSHTYTINNDDAAANQPPTDITLSPSQVIDGTDTTGGFDMTLGAVDPDGGETFTYTKIGAGADQAVFSLSGNTLTLTDGLISYDTPGDANSDRVYEVEVQVEDSAANTYSETLLVTIVPDYNPMLHSSLSTGSAKWGGDWGTATGKYGEFACNTCHAKDTGNIKRVKTSLSAPNGTDQFPIEAGAGTVVFNSVTGPGSFGDDAGGHAASNRICEGCHSQNKYHNYNTVNNTDGFNHENQKDCISCHAHSKGFSASCDTCHGNPPVTANLDSTGLVFDPEVTDATNPASPGAHELHAVTEGMSCTTCHKGNTMPTVSMTIQMGFEASNGNWSQFTSTATGGNLEAPDDTAGQMSASYEFVSSDGGTTTITKVANNDLTCSVYCHGDWTGNGGQTATSWVGGSTMTDDCNDCHGGAAATPPTAGSHQTHAGNGAGDLALACSKCHPSYSDTAHLDGDVAWALDTTDSKFTLNAEYDPDGAVVAAASGSTGAKAPSSAYGTCLGLYCHSQGEGTAPIQTPQWGNTATGECGDCHNVGTSMATGKHSLHVNPGTAITSAIGCQTCHVSTSSDGSTVTGAALHIDEQKNVAILGTWDDDAVPGNDYADSNCSAVYCHSSGQVSPVYNSVTWGESTSGCGFCHNSGAAMATGDHSVHVNDGTIMSNVNCDVCHISTTADGSSIATVALHINKSRDVTIKAAYDGGGTAADDYGDNNCSDVYCHSDGQASWTAKTVAWGDTSSGCNFCHNSGTSMASGSHTPHVNDTGNQVGWNIGCADCHSSTASGNTTIGTPGNHLNISRDIGIAANSDQASCTDISCHSNGNFGGTTFAYQTDTNYQWGVDSLAGCDDCHGDGAGKAYPTYTDGGIGEDSNSHATHITGPGYTCEECHNTTATGNALKSGGTAQHVDQTIDVAGAKFTWNGGTETCSNIACHFNNNAQWGDTLGCADCHGNPPNTNAHLTHAGSGAGEYGLACSTCHPEDHDGTVADITFTGVAATWGGAAYSGSVEKQCSNLYCHGGATADWDAGTGGVCGDCHGAVTTGRPDGANEPSGGSHLTTSHQVACNNCHSHDGTDVTEHVNGPAATYGDALVNSAGLNVTNYVYNATSSLASSPDPDGYDYSGGTCSTSCHSDATWGGTGGCTFCHGGSGLYYPQTSTAPDRAAEHAAHIYALETKLGYTHGTTDDAQQQTMCAYCHNDADGVGGNGHHGDGDAAVGDFNPMWNGATADDGSFDQGVTDTCSNIDCHYNKTTADSWYGTGDAGCAYCHADGVATYAAGDLPNVHDKHVDETADSGYNMTCAICHGSSGYAQDHANGSSGTDVTFTGTVATQWASPSYSGAGTKQCSNLYCHGSATADWDAGTGGACGDCHGAAGTGRPDGIDEPSGGSHLTGSHQVACTTCHSHDGTDETEHVNGDGGRNGDALVSNAGSSITSYTYGSTLASSPDPDGYKYSGGTCATSCHGDNDWGGTASCVTCHNGSGSGATLVSASSTHSNNLISTATSGVISECEHCHFDSHGNRDPSTNNTVAINWDSRTMGALTAAQDALDGKIYLNSTILGEAGEPWSSEAEVCWNCHNNYSITEWNSTADADVTAPGPRPAGYLSTNGPNWIGAEWSSANFSYKTGSIVSVHETQEDTASAPSVTDDTDHVASPDGTQDAVADISCSACHDVHSIADGNADAEPKPYLRGTWTSNPFPEDGAPRTTATGGVQATYATNIRAQDANTVIPRAGALESGNNENALGGWQIEQNNPGAFADTTEYSTYGGLCRSCHSASSLETAWAGHGVAAGSEFTGASGLIYDPAVRGETNSWEQAMMGHLGITLANTRGTAVGGTDTYVHGLRNGNKINNSYPQDGIGTIWANDPEQDHAGIISASFGDGAITTIDAGPGRTAATNFHNFPCSKCHDPHASRLPRLLVTNCLDVEKNTVDDSLHASSWTATNNTYTAQDLAYSPTAANCHRYVDAAASVNEEVGSEPGWNSVTPW